MHRRVLVLMHKDRISRLDYILNNMIETGDLYWDWYMLGGRYSHMIPVSKNSKKVITHREMIYAQEPEYQTYADLHCHHGVMDNIDFVDVCKVSQLRLDIIQHIVAAHGWNTIADFAEMITDVDHITIDGQVRIAEEIRDIICEEDTDMVYEAWHLVTGVAQNKRLAQDFYLCVIDAHY